MPAQTDAVPLQIRGVTISQPVSCANGTSTTNVLANEAATSGKICAMGTADYSLARVGTLSKVYGLVLDSPESTPGDTPPIGNANLQEIDIPAPQGGQLTANWEFTANNHKLLDGAKCGDSNNPQMNVAAFWFYYESGLGFAYIGPHSVLFAGVQASTTGCDGRIELAVKDRSKLQIQVFQPLDCLKPEHARAAVRVNGGKYFATGRIRKKHPSLTGNAKLKKVYARILRGNDFKKKLPGVPPNGTDSVAPLGDTGYWEFATLPGANHDAHGRQSNILAFWFEYEDGQGKKDYEIQLTCFRGRTSAKTENPEEQ